MNWFIDDADEITIYITDGWREFFVPKFRTAMTVEEPYLFLHWNDRERGDGGDERMIQIDYQDVVSGYGGYISGASSATQLKETLEAYIVSAWNNTPTYDSDAQTAINAIGTLNDYEEQALSNLFVYLKANSVFTPIKALWLLRGGTAASTAVNAVNPGTFDLIHVGSPSFNYYGVKYNGTNYSRTGIIPTTHLTQNSTMLYFSRRDNGNSGVEMGTEAPASSGLLLAARNGGNSVHIQYQFPSNYMVAAQSTSIGDWAGIRTSNIVQKTFKGDVQQGATDTDAAAGWPNLTYEIYLGGTNSSGSLGNGCACEIDTYAVCDGMSDAEYALFRIGINRFKYEIGI